MYAGPAARQYTKVKKRSPQATTEELIAEMKMLINGVTQRKSSEEIRKLRLSVNAVLLRSLFVKASNRGAIVGHLCSAMGLWLHRHARCGHYRSRDSIYFKGF
jgi:hypothetical protein